MTIPEIKIKIRDFLSQKLNNHQVQDDEDIFALGLVNSLFALELVTYLETEFSIAVESEDLELDKFRTINAIAQFVQDKMK